jgi:hypothetical protein
VMKFWAMPRMVQNVPDSRGFMRQPRVEGGVRVAARETTGMDEPQVSGPAAA